ncbi:unnamed protein product [Cyprideis torosa]|uniref:Uncharacterized protein n=1 Tax=Cyprideis torosa TaxID=163714 RepID=A0A7R8W2Y9_9CRUS|nr:unnamed protein product [Cyprideis torosa]CAG0882470.1 unnamed protein product [Cyprideis torosa]
MFAGRWSCLRCGKTYGAKFNLKHHLRYKCGVQPQFVCPVCGKEYVVGHAFAASEIFTFYGMVSIAGRWSCSIAGNLTMAGNKINRYLYCKCGVDSQCRCVICGENLTCPRCGRSYSRKPNLAHHMRYKCGVQPQFKCNLCGREYRNKSSLVVHTVSAHRLTCPRCGRSYSRRPNLNRHLNYECGVEPQFKCVKCHKAFKYRYGLEKHVALMCGMQSQPHLSCSRCGRHYSRRPNLNRHLKYECGVEPQFECFKCHKRFKRRYELRMHGGRKFIHKTPPLASLFGLAQGVGDGTKSEALCYAICDWSVERLQSLNVMFVDENFLIVRIWYLIGISVSPTATCIMTSVMAFILFLADDGSWMMDLVTRMWSCQRCGKQYKWRDSLKRHVRLECGVPPKFECNLCGRKFSQRSNMMSHRLLVHKYLRATNRIVGGAIAAENSTSGKSRYEDIFVGNAEFHHSLRFVCRRLTGFVCRRCGRTYKQSSSLVRHVRFECGVPPQFECDICRRKFFRKTEIPVGEGPFEVTGATPACMIAFLRQFSVEANLTPQEGAKVTLQTDASKRDKTSLVTHRALIHDYWLGEERKWRCPRCFRTYHRKDSLQRHLKNECGVEPKFECPICGKKFSQKANRKKHVLLSHKVQVDLFIFHVLNGAELKNTIYQAVNTHVALGYGGALPREPVFVGGEWKWPCLRCNRMYRNKRTVYTHIIYECGVEPKFACNLCDRKFAQKSNFKKHMVLLHGMTVYVEMAILTLHRIVPPVHALLLLGQIYSNGEWRWKCTRCPKTYRTRRSCLRHLDYECGVIPKFKCDICGKKFAQKSNVKKHMRVHGVFSFYLLIFLGSVFLNGEKRWKCPRCPKTYSTKWTCSRHIHLECGVEPKFGCRVCGRKFTQKYNLKTHEHMIPCVRMESGNGIVPIVPRPILIEGVFTAIYATSAVLVNGEWRWKCPNCPKSYANRGSLYSRHLRYECGVQPMFCCQWCNKTFAHKFTFKKHLLYIHKLEQPA